jgi:hypothetical protein
MFKEPLMRVLLPAIQLLHCDSRTGILIPSHRLDRIVVIQRSLRFNWGRGVCCDGWLENFDVLLSRLFRVQQVRNAGL